jgi:hypothetical protein
MAAKFSLVGLLHNSPLDGQAKLSRLQKYTLNKGLCRLETVLHGKGNIPNFSEPLRRRKIQVDATSVFSASRPKRTLAESSSGR